MQKSLWTINLTLLAVEVLFWSMWAAIFWTSGVVESFTIMGMLALAIVFLPILALLVNVFLVFGSWKMLRLERNFSTGTLFVISLIGLLPSVFVTHLFKAFY